MLVVCFCFLWCINNVHLVQVKNLRSGVSRVAVCTLGDLYTHLQKAMDQELEGTVKALLQKAGESNAFIRQDVDAALDCMVQHCTPTRSISALLSGGLRSVWVGTDTHNGVLFVFGYFWSILNTFFSPKFLFFDCWISFSFSNSHLNAVVRKCTAQHLANLVEKVGALRLLSGVKDLTDRILHAITKLAQDSSQETRYVETLFVLGLHVLWF